VGEEPGNLPLLEFVLTSLWDRRQGGELLHEAYDHIGGMQGAIAKRADEIYDTLNRDQQAAVRRILLQLIRPGAGSEDTRRRAALKEIGKEAHQVLGELAQQRLLVTGRDESSGEETVEVAHEALIQHWKRLRDWLEEDRDFLMWRHRLQAACAEWQRTGHDSGALLRGAPLAEAERWVSERQGDLTDDERGFIGESVRSRNRKRGLLWMGAAAAVIVSAAIAIWQYTEVQRLQLERRPILPEMVEIPPGSFVMGSAEGETEAYAAERPPREITIEKPFKIGKFEVTFFEYDKFALATERRPPSDQGWGGGKRPVINLSWEDARDYAKWLSEQTGQRYRLPTEAEWEYAARAKTITRRYWSDDPARACNYANVFDRKNEAYLKSKYGITWEPHGCKDDFPETAPVGSFEPNDFMLHDMLGNVWEWVQDCWHDNYGGAPDDQTAWEEEGCDQRVIRGGSWFDLPRGVRSADRGRDPPDGRIGNIGFRLAQDVD